MTCFEVEDVLVDVVEDVGPVSVTVAIPHPIALACAAWWEEAESMRLAWAAWVTAGRCPSHRISLRRVSAAVTATPASVHAETWFDTASNSSFIIIH